MAKFIDEVIEIIEEESVNRFLESLANPRKVDIPDKDLKAENEKGLKILKRKFQRGFQA